MKVYLDNGASTHVDSAVLKEIIPYLKNECGNASSLHTFGVNARSAVEEARERIAKALDAQTEDIVFTSGGTESDNLAIRGVCKAVPNKKTIITSEIEHPAILDTCADLAKEGYKTKLIKVDKEGIIDLEQLKNEINGDTVLVSIMHANNEIGTVQPIKEIYEICKTKKAVFHTDAVQSFTKTKLNSEMADLISISGHKIHAPKGVGALYIKKGTPIKKIQTGSHQELNMRGGTENVPAIVGFGKAAILKIDLEKMKKQRDRLIKELLKIKETNLNGSHDQRLPNNVNISFHRIEGEAMLLSLDAKGVAVSTGSACTSRSLKPSHVLIAIGVDPANAHGSLRFTLSKYTTDKEIDYTIKAVKEVVEKLRKITAM